MLTTNLKLALIIFPLQLPGRFSRIGELLAQLGLGEDFNRATFQKFKLFCNRLCHRFFPNDTEQHASGNDTRVVWCKLRYVEAVIIRRWRKMASAGLASI